MDVSAISSTLASATPAERTLPTSQSEKIGEASRQFESILLRQFLSESMKPLLEGGESGKVYGYLLTDTLANSLSEGGGMGLASVLQAQLGRDTK